SHSGSAGTAVGRSRIARARRKGGSLNPAEAGLVVLMCYRTERREAATAFRVLLFGFRSRGGAIDAKNVEGLIWMNRREEKHQPPLGRGLEISYLALSSSIRGSVNTSRGTSRNRNFLIQEFDSRC